MGLSTSISWTDLTWNIGVGCHKVDKDCLFCYMYRDSMNGTRYIPNVVRKTKTVFNLPLKYKKTKSEVWDGPPLVFTSSLTDVFHPGIDSFRQEAFDIIKRCPQLTFQLLTKRPERILAQLPANWGENGYENVWLGTSIGHQGAIHRLEELSALKTKESSFLTFLSLEPLHSEIDFLSAHPKAFSTLDWVIIGGESGNENGRYGYRECKIEWIESIIDQCDKHHIPVFVKQLGTYLAKKLGLTDRHGTRIEQWPAQLARQQFPANRYAMT